MFVTRIRPRVSETDGVGHINNTTIPVWLEAGREEIFRMFTPDLSFRNWRMIIVNMKIDFLKEMVLGQEVEVRTWVKKIGRTSLQLEEEIIKAAGCACVENAHTSITIWPNARPNQFRPTFASNCWPMFEKILLRTND